MTTKRALACGIRRTGIHTTGRSIWRGFGVEVVNDEGIHGDLCGLEFEAELFLDCGEEGRQVVVGGIGIVVGLVAEIDVEDAGQAGVSSTGACTAAERRPAIPSESTPRPWTMPI